MALDPQVRLAIRRGLWSSPRWLPSDTLYGDTNSIALFQRAAAATCYQIARVEPELIKEQMTGLAARMPSGGSVVYYGGTSSAKADLVTAAIEPAWYVAIDLSQEGLDKVRADFKNKPFKTYTIRKDFLKPIELPSEIDARPILGLCLGVTIGNFGQRDVEKFLRNAWRTLGENAHLLVSIDIVVDGEYQEKAYGADGDAAIAAFMLNSLNTLKHETGANFNSALFRYRPIWHAPTQCLNSCLVAQSDHCVQIFGRHLHLDRGEPIILAKSYKYTVDEFTRLACDSTVGWQLEKYWRDRKDLCALVLLKRDDLASLKES